MVSSGNPLAVKYITLNMIVATTQTILFAPKLITQTTIIDKDKANQ